MLFIIEYFETVDRPSAINATNEKEAEREKNITDITVALDNEINDIMLALDQEREEEEREQREREEKQREEEEREKERRLQEAMLSIRKRYGKNAILKGTSLQDGATMRERNRSIGGHKA
jgi:septal ring factor EnvC (AmiA/AmiB activator)